MDIAHKKMKVKLMLAKYNLAYETMELLHKRNLNCINCNIEEGRKIKDDTQDLQEAVELANELLQDIKDTIKEVSKNGTELS